MLIIFIHFLFYDALFVGIGLAVAAIWLNPKEVDFQERHLEANNIMVLVSKPIKNPVSEKHVDHINSLYSDDRIRYTSCLFLSFMWKDNFCREVGLYESQCSYLKPSLRKFYDRIEDIGFWGKWWIYEEKMKDFDVSPAEWSDTSVLNLGVVNPRGFTIS